MYICVKPVGLVFQAVRCAYRAVPPTATNKTSGSLGSRGRIGPNPRQTRGLRARLR